MFSILTPSIPIWGGLPLYWDGIGPPPQASLGIGGPLSPCKGNEKELKKCSHMQTTLWRFTHKPGQQLAMRE